METRSMPDHLPAVIPPPTGASLPALGQADLLAAFLAGRSPTTVRSYSADLRHFAAFVQAPDVKAAVDLLLTGGQGPANGVMLNWRNAMDDAGLAPNTINRRLAAMKSVVKLARTLGQVAWSIDLPALKVMKYRDVRGPGVDGYRAMLEVLDGQATTPKGKRDRAIIRLLRDRGLRRGELVALDLAHYSPGEAGGSISVMGKGRREREELAIGKGTARALDDWIAARGSAPGPLFIGLHVGAKHSGTTRLTGEAVRLIVKAAGEVAGVGRVVRPHGLRHQAVTDALEAGHPIRDVQKFSRHADLNTLTVYDDRRKDVGGGIARGLGGE